MTLTIELSEYLIRKIGYVPGMQQLTDSVKEKILNGYYGDVVDKFEIIPQIDTQEAYDNGMSENFAMCDWCIGSIGIFLRMSMEYEDFFNAPAEEKVYQAAKTALEAIKIVGKRARGRLDHRKLLRDVFSAYDESIQKRLLSEGFKLPNIRRAR